MRINTKVVWDLESMEVIERESYDYSGPVESCDPGTIALIGLLVSGAFGGAELGLNIANKPSTPGPTPTPVPTQAQNNQAAAAQKQAQEASVSGAFPTLQQQTGGSLSPEATVLMASILTGNAGAPGIGATGQDLITKILTGAGGSSSSGSPVTAGSGGSSGSPVTTGLTTTSFG